MSLTMVEIVARAIGASDKSGRSWEALSEDTHRVCLGMARAAIEAMRGPTEGMLHAAEDHKNRYYLTEGNDYSVMIDAALREHSK